MIKQKGSLSFISNASNTISDPLDDFINAGKDIIAGSCRGIAQVLSGHPLDTIKVRLQTQNKANPMFKGVGDCVWQTFKKEGIQGFYKGAASPLTGCAFYSATLFLSYGQSKRIFDLDNQPTLARQVMASGFTGFCAAFVEGPVDLLKCKMQIQYQRYTQEAARSTGPQVPLYRSSFDCAFQLMRQHGPMSLFQGLPATILRNVPGSAMYFTVYEVISHFLAPKKEASMVSAGAVMVAGGIGGMAFWTVIYPVDVVKSCLQTDHSDPKYRKYKGIVDCFKQIIQREGWYGLWKGYSICMIRSFPVNAVTFLTFETTRKLLG